MFHEPAKIKDSTLDSMAFFAETVVFHWSVGISDRSIWANKIVNKFLQQHLVMFECYKESECVKQQRTGDSTPEKPGFGRQMRLQTGKWRLLI